MWLLTSILTSLGGGQRDERIDVVFWEGGQDSSADQASCGRVTKTGSIRTIMTGKTARVSLWPPKDNSAPKITRTRHWAKQTPNLYLNSTSRHSGTLRVADKMDPICSVLHYWVNSCLESLHLLPHGLQAGAPVKQVDDRHVGARMGLPRRGKQGQSERAWATKGQQKHSPVIGTQHLCIHKWQFIVKMQKLTVAERMWSEAPLLVVHYLQRGSRNVQ